MATFNVEDQVEVDTPGMAFHGYWGVVTLILEDNSVWVELVNHTSIANAPRPLNFPIRFSPWELRMLKHAERDSQ